MKSAKLLDLYSDFLTSSPNVVSALLLSSVLDNTYSHDAITRMLAQNELSQKDYWQFIKPTVRHIEREAGIISIDDTIEHKPYSDENEIIAWHYDHTSGKSVKGINIVTFTYVTSEKAPSVESDPLLSIQLPISYEIVRKDIKMTTVEGKEHRKASVSKNDLFCTRLKTFVFQNHIKFRYVTFDTWYSSADNMQCIVKDLKKHFVCAVKDNRTVTFQAHLPKKEQQWEQVSQLEIEPNRIYRVRLKDLDFDVLLVKKVFHNLNGSLGVQFLISSDTDLTAEQLVDVYKKRWSSEELHRSLKENTALAKMPAKMECSQANHIFASMIAQVKLECLKLSSRQNHYTLKRNILVKALKVAWKEINELKELCLTKNIKLPNFQTA